MTPDTPVSELELLVLACAQSPVCEEELLARAADLWVSPAPQPSGAALLGALMAVRESGLLDSVEPHAFRTSARGRRLLQRAVCGALGAPRTGRPGGLTFPQAMALAGLLPVTTLVTVLRTRLDALDNEQTALASSLREAHERGDHALHIAALNLREGLLNAERAFLFTFVGDVEKGFLSLSDPSVTPPVVQETATARA